MTTYKFITKQNQDDDNNVKTRTSFYQIALYANPKTNLRHVRKFIIDESDNIIKMSEYNIKQKYYEQLLKQKKTHEYKQYSVYDLGTIGYPQRGDVLLLKSNILSGGGPVYGFAPF